MLKPRKLLSLSYPCTFASFLLCATAASATTTLTSANFDLDGDATWDNGVPSEFGDPDGLITTDYNFDDLGDTNVNGNFNASTLGVVSITQTAGNGIGDQYNVYNNPDFTFNLNGGTMTSDGGTFILNGTKFNVAGGTLSTLEFRTANGSSMTVSNGSFTASAISLRGGTFTQTGGTVTSNHGGPVFNRANTNNTLNLTGGNVVAGTGNNNSLIQHTGVFTTIGGSFSANLPAAVNLFAGGIHTNNSTINFTSDWTGSLTLDSTTAWDDIFEAGDVSVDGIELGADDFEIYFENSNGVITLMALPVTPKWSGIGGSIWDSATTSNFATNDPADPLNNTTFDVATALVNAVIFDDTYEFGGGSTAVASFAVDVAAGGILDTAVSFTNDSNAYVVSSSDANGISGTAQVIASGASTVTFLGTHAYTGATTIEAGTLSLGDGSTDGSIVDSAITNNAALVVNNTGSITHNAIIAGSGSFEKQGAGTLTLAANYHNTGSVTLTAGELVFQGNPRASSHSIAASTVLEFGSAGGFNNGAGFDTIFTGAGTLRNMSAGEARWGEAKAVFELGSGALIDVQSGSFAGGSHGNIASRAEEWTNNLSDLNVESAATFKGAEANVRVNVLTGSGIIESGGNPVSTGYTAFTFGVDDGSGDFAGRLDNNATTIGNYTKVGSGTQTLSGMNFYTGNTTVEAGVLTVASGGELTMAPTANNVTNVIAGVAEGTGTINLDGALYLELGATELTDGNSWLLVDDTNLSVNYGASFAIFSTYGAFVESGGVWTLVSGDNTWEFSEATGELSLTVVTTGFADYLAQFPGLSDTTAEGDDDKDNIENILEYVLNGDPEVSDTSILPTLDASGADFVFTFTRREESAADTTQTFEYGSDLENVGGWTSLDIETATEVSLGTPAGGLQTVTVTISKSLAVGDKLFGRLVAAEVAE